MRTKRLLCVCAALALLLSVPARAAEGTAEVTEDTAVTETVPTDPDPAFPEETPEAPEEPPEVPEDPDDGEPEPPAPAEDGDLVTDEETPDGEEAPAGDDPEESEEPEDEPEDEEAEEEDGTINVLIPSGGRVIVNPYHLPVAMPQGVTTEQVIHEPQTLVNLRSVPVQVDVWAAGAFDGPSAAVFTSAPPAAGSVDKEIFMYAEFQPFPGQGTGMYGNFDNQLLITGWG